MAFVYPGVLWALLAVAAPVIIHLFNFRKYKKVYFTNVRFLKELQFESKSKSRLKELLILCLRCLAIACLVLAFSQPVWLNKEGNQTQSLKKVVALYIDNSFSSNSLNRQGPLIETLKLKAGELIKAFGPSCKYYILTNDFEGRHQRLYSDEEALRLIEELKPSASTRLLSDVVLRQNEFLSSYIESGRYVYLLSDAQTSTFNFKACKFDTSFFTTLIPVYAAEVNNVFVDSCWFETPVQQQGTLQKLHAKIKNCGTKSIDVASAILKINTVQLALASFSLQPDASTEIIFAFEIKQAGLNFGSIKIDDYPVSFDDELYFAFNSEPRVNLCHIKGKQHQIDKALSSLFASDSLFKLKEFAEQSVDYGTFKNSDVIVLNQLSEISSGMYSELVNYSKAGGTVVFIPSTESTSTLTSNSLLNALSLPQLVSLDTASVTSELPALESGFFDGVFEKTEERMNTPTVNQHFILSQQVTSNFEPLIKLQNGNVWFGRLKKNVSNTYLFAGPLSEKGSSFTKHALFVPTFYKIAFSSLKSPPLFYTLGSNIQIRLKREETQSETPPYLQKLGEPAELIPERRVLEDAVVLNVRQNSSGPGFYELKQNKKVLLPVAMNYSRLESNLKAFSEEELQKGLEELGSKKLSLLEDSQKDTGKNVLSEIEGKKLWKLFIILTLIMLALEMLLLRLLK